jgi:hypothetical protein
MEFQVEEGYNGTLMISGKLNGVQVHQKTAIFKLAAVRTSNPTSVCQAKALNFNLHTLWCMQASVNFAINETSAVAPARKCMRTVVSRFLKLLL